jgi:hypothetical protein
MFVLDGKETDFTEEDKQRRNLIISYLQDWGLLKVLNEDGILDKCESHMITVLPYGEKHKYTLQAKYTIGSRKSTSRVGSA